MIRNAAELGTAIRAARLGRGLTQDGLGRRVGLSRKCIGDLEAGKERAELGSALAVAGALGLWWQTPAPTPQAVLEEAAAGIRRELAHGDSDMALRIALDATNRLRRMPTSSLKKPHSTGDPRWDALLAGGARIARRGVTEKKLRWGSRLAEPWFPGAETRQLGDRYRQLTIRRTPKELAELNIYLNDTSLSDR